MMFRLAFYVHALFLGCLFHQLSFANEVSPDEAVSGINLPTGFSLEAHFSDQLKQEYWPDEVLRAHLQAFRQALLFAFTIPGEPGTAPHPFVAERPPNSVVAGEIIFTRSANTTSPVSHGSYKLEVEFSSASFAFMGYEPGSSPPVHRPIFIVRLDRAPIDRNQWVGWYFSQIFPRLYTALAFHLEYPEQRVLVHQSRHQVALYGLEQIRRVRVGIDRLLQMPFPLPPFAAQHLISERDLEWYARQRDHEAALLNSERVSAFFSVPEANFLYPVESPFMSGLSKELHAEITRICAICQNDAKRPLAECLPNGLLTSARNNPWRLFRKSMGVFFCAEAEWHQYVAKLKEQFASAADSVSKEEIPLMIAEGGDHQHGWFVLYLEATGGLFLYTAPYSDKIFVNAEKQLREDAHTQYLRVLGKLHGGIAAAFMDTPYYEMRSLRDKFRRGEIQIGGHATAISLLDGSELPHPLEMWQNTVVEEKKRLEAAQRCAAQILAAASN